MGMQGLNPQPSTKDTTGPCMSTSPAPMWEWPLACMIEMPTSSCCSWVSRDSTSSRVLGSTPRLHRFRNQIAGAKVRRGRRGGCRGGAGEAEAPYGMQLATVRRKRQRDHPECSLPACLLSPCAST